MNWLLILNFSLASAGLVTLLVTVALAVDYFANKSRYYKRYVAPFIWPLLLSITLGSLALTLLYSEYFGFMPCSLCWLQRIALYPQALFAVMAFKTKEHVYYPTYSLALSVFGFGVAVYHYLFQLVPKESIIAGLMPCLADGTAECGTLIMKEFGFITFPFLAAVTFALLIVLYLNLMRSKHK